MGIKRHFSREFKLSILKELETKRLAEVCRAHNIAPSTVSGWRKDYEENPNHPFYINRTVLTKNSNRFCVIPALDNRGVSSNEINGISELRIRFYFRINPHRGETDKDLKHLEVYATPPVIRGL